MNQVLNVFSNFGFFVVAFGLRSATFSFRFLVVVVGFCSAFYHGTRDANDANQEENLTYVAGFLDVAAVIWLLTWMCYYTIWRSCYQTDSFVSIWASLLFSMSFAMSYDYIFSSWTILSQLFFPGMALIGLLLGLKSGFRAFWRLIVVVVAFVLLYWFYQDEGVCYYGVAGHAITHLLEAFLCWHWSILVLLS